MDASSTANDVRVCRFPDCDRPAAAGESGSGRPPEYCDDPAHNRAAAWRARQAQRSAGAGGLGSRGDGRDGGRVEGRPVDAARARASDIRAQVSGMIEHLEGQLRVLVEELATVGDLDAAEAQAESVASDAAEKVASAVARATRAEQAQRLAEADRVDADLITAETIERIQLLESELVEAQTAAGAAETARLQLVEELASVVAASETDRESNRSTVALLETELSTVRGSLTEVQRDQEATATRLATMTATAVTAESRATTAIATAAATVVAVTERAERAEAQLQTGRESVDTLRKELSVEHDRVGAATSQVAVLILERDNAVAAMLREREYADQRVTDLRRTFERPAEGSDNSDARTSGSAAGGAEPRTQKVDKAKIRPSANSGS
jgi:colicin import membrane protein